jgi:phytoene/squalene synthetase
MMNPKLTLPDPILALAITKAASSQTYHTIRLLADRDRRADAYRAYAYFRWVDDVLDGEAIAGPERTAFINRQQKLLEVVCHRGEIPFEIGPEETLLVDLVSGDMEKNSGLQSYVTNMMAVMSFDAGRRGRLISHAELNEYTHCLASAVTEAMHYFIGHRCYSPRGDVRYQAVTAAHITHMLRDTCDDIRAGYFNIPREVLEEGHISPQDVGSAAYQAWVRSRVQLARECFKTGTEYLGRVKSRRCRLAGYAYTTRFEGVLDSIEKDGYILRSSYAECRGVGAMARASGSILASFLFGSANRMAPVSFPARPRAQRDS